MTKKLALVTNVKDFVGPPAVTALMEGSFHTGTIIKFAGGWPAAPKRPI
jgi:hypothetical protein